MFGIAPSSDWGTMWCWGLNPDPLPVKHMLQYWTFSLGPVLIFRQGNNREERLRDFLWWQWRSDGAWICDWRVFHDIFFLERNKRVGSGTCLPGHPLYWGALKLQGMSYEQMKKVSLLISVQNSYQLITTIVSWLKLSEDLQNSWSQLWPWGHW